MKKALVILLALSLVGAVFAADPSVSGDATLSWGVDLDTGFTGFKNEATFSVKLPLFAKGTVSKGGEGDVYGYIEFKDLEWNLTDTIVAAGAFAGEATGSVSAKIVFKPFEVAVYTAPSLAINKMADISTGDVEFAGAGSAGTSLKYSGDPVTVTLKVLSDGDWTANASNEYAIGADVAFVAVKDLLKLNVAAAYDLSPSDTNFYVGVDAPITVAGVMKGLDVTPGADFVIGTAIAYDMGASVALKLTDANADDKRANVAFKGYYSSSDANAEISASFDEPLAGGFVDNAEFGAAVKSIDFLGAAVFPWALETYAGYKAIIDETNNLYGRVDFDTDSAQTNNLLVKVVFTNTMVANTTMTVTYESGNLLANPAVKGKIIAAAKIKY